MIHRVLLMTAIIALLNGPIGVAQEPKPAPQNELTVTQAAQAFVQSVVPLEKQFNDSRSNEERLSTLAEILSLELAGMKQAAETLPKADERRSAILAMLWDFAKNSCANAAQLHSQTADANPETLDTLLESALKLTAEVFGSENWRIGELRRIKQDQDAASELDGEKRQQLETAIQLQQESFQLYQSGKINEALTALRKAYDAFQQSWGSDHVETARAASNLGFLEQKGGNLKRAAELNQIAFEIRKQQLGDEHPDTITSINNLGFLNYGAGNFAEARHYFERAAKASEKSFGHFHPKRLTHSGNLAMVAQELGEYAKAKRLLEESVSDNTFVHGENHDETASAINNLATLLMATGEYNASRKLFERSLVLREKLLGKAHPITAESYNNLGMLLLETGDFAGAAMRFESALAVFRKVYPAEHPRVAIGLNNLALALSELNEEMRAIELNREAEAIRQKTLGPNHPLTLQSQLHLASSLRKTGEQEEAFKYLKSAYDGAQATLPENHPDLAQYRHDLAVHYRSVGENQRALELFRASYETLVDQTVGMQSMDSVRAANNLAAHLDHMGQHAEAIALSKDAANGAFANLERVSDAQGLVGQHLNQTSWRAMLDAYLCLSAREADGEEYAELFQWKGAILARQLAYQMAGRAPETQDIVSRLQKKASELSSTMRRPPKTEAARPAWKQQVEQLSLEVEQLQRDIAEANADFRLGADTSIEDLVKALPPNGVFVDFISYWHHMPPKDGEGTFQGERRIAAFIIKPNSKIVRINLGAEDEIASQVNRWRATLTDTDYLSPQKLATQESLGRELRRLVWAPLEEALAERQTVLISPDGALCGLPFTALPGQSPDSFLIQEATIAYVPIPRLVPLIAQQDLESEQSASSGILALGGISYGEVAQADKGESAAAESFDYLPGTKQEVDSIAATWAASNDQPAKILVGELASEDSFINLAPQFEYIHIASHAYFDTQPIGAGMAIGSDGADSLSASFSNRDRTIGTRSGLALAGANSDSKGDGSAAFDRSSSDGILTAAEVSPLDLLGCKLVVLSACETSLGVRANGEGLLGLQRSFQAAGVNSVISSLWRVDDTATQALMTEFYKNLWERKLSKIDALREAQLKMIRDYNPQTGKIRGLGSKIVTVAEASTDDASQTRLSPRFWAAFQLSGNWK